MTPSLNTTPTITPTRTAALARLSAFAPAMGRAYAARRNFDFGPPGEGRDTGGAEVSPTFDFGPEPEPNPEPTPPLRSNVSVLSPWLRHRLLNEPEVLAAATTRHGDDSAKFVSEVLWRGYFKGWLEQRPSVWAAYVRDRDAALADVAGKDGLAKAYDQAVTGATGIDCFDAWAQELRATGWLHNHARMWFASIWIFTLRLPWTLGADFFLSHLLDGDPASNTLSWRWVAGLHTKGKAYAARAANITRYTAERFAPTGLNEAITPLEEADEHLLIPFAPGETALPPGDYALLVHDDDGWWEDIAPERPPVAVLGLSRAADRGSAVSADVQGFARAAVADAASRAGAHYGVPVTLLEPDQRLDAWSGAHDGLPLVAPHIPAGPLRDSLSAAERACLHGQVHRYDAALWPLATAGFFKLKTKAGKALAPLDIALPRLR